MLEKHCKKNKKKKKRERERERKRRNEKMPRNWQKRAGKSATAQGENPEISARKVLKTHKIPPIEHRKMLRKYKFRIYYRIY